MLKKQFWLTLLICASLCIIVVFWITLHQAMSTQKLLVHSTKPEQHSSDEFEKMTIRIPGAEKNGYWELHVNQGTSFQDDVHLNHIEGQYFINKKSIYQISGNTGVIYWKTRVLQLNGSVVLKTDDESKILNAEELLWNPTLKNLIARRGAILKTPQTTITTDGIVSNLKMDQVVFTGLTKVVYQRVDHD